MAISISYDITTQRSKVVQLDELICSFLSQTSEREGPNFGFVETCDY